MTAASPAMVTTFLPAVYVAKHGAASADHPLEANTVTRLVVDCHLHLPDMFEITFGDRSFDVVDRNNIEIGSLIEIWSAGRDVSDSKQLIVGEVTSIEGTYVEDVPWQTIVRGYTHDHRLQRVRRTRTFVGMSYSDIASEIVNGAGLKPDTIESTRTVYDHVGQVNQTDWDFLRWHAATIGYEIGMKGGKFFFRKSSAVSGAGAEPVELCLRKNLFVFYPRVTAGNLTEEAEVRGWDPLKGQSVTAKGQMSTGSVQLDAGDPKKLSTLFEASTSSAKPAASNPAVGDLGPAPSTKAHVHSVSVSVDSAAQEVLAGALENLGSTVAEAEGEAIGDPRLTAGSVVNITEVPSLFAGKWVISNARHVFDPTVSGYRTHFEVAGRQQRSLLGLASSGAVQRAARPTLDGLASGIVTNVNDPQSKSRVKVVLPWLSPQYESDWAPVVQFGGGKATGAVFLPDVGDQVIVGFEFGDPQRPYVLGGVVNNNSKYFAGGLGAQPVKATGSTATPVWRGFVTPSGNRLAFHDEMPPGSGSGKPIASDLVLGTSDGAFALTIDQVKGTVALSCTPSGAAGNLTIQCGETGSIKIIAGAGATVSIDGGTALEMKAKESVKLESQGVVEIKGQVVKIN